MGLSLKLQITAPPDIERAALSAALVEAAEILDEEAFHKAVESGCEHNIWAPHPEPLISFCEETWYVEVNSWLERIFEEASQLLLGEPLRLQKAIDESYLESLEKLIAFHFGKAKRSAEAGVVRAHIAGLFRASEDEKEAVQDFGKPESWPETVAELARVIRKKDVWHGKESYSRLQVAADFAADEITKISEDTRSGMRKLIYQAELNHWGPNLLERELYHNFRALQRDWRRIALTETASNSNNAYLLRAGEGNYVTCPQVAGACRWCAATLENKVFRIVTDPMADDRIEDSYAERAVWIGKTNVGRYLSIRERGGRMREEDELWWVCCPGHPHCRHVFIKHNPMYGPPGPRLPMSEEELAASPNKPSWLIGIDVHPITERGAIHPQTVGVQ